MKRMIVLMVLALMLVGCGRVESVNFDEEIKSLEQHTEEFATGGGDIGEFREVVEDFNAKLEKLGDNDFAKIQRKANDKRFEAFAEMDHAKINESTALQAEALVLYNEMKNAN